MMRFAQFTKLVVLSGALLLASGCEKDKFSAPMKLGGKEIAAAQLNSGWEGYMLYCYACHGEKGDGHGPSAPGLRPPPRDFTQGLFKFGGVQAPALPPDSELRRIVRGGLHGTAMLPWQLPDQVLDDVIQYLKTLSPRWKTEEVGKPIEKSADPYYPARKAEAIELGKRLYHAKAQCSGCHPSYVSHEELAKITKEMNGTAQAEFNPDMYFSQIKDSEYCLEWKKSDKKDQKLEDRECAQVVKVMPPDFTRSHIRAGGTLDDLYRTIASGIGGANMPTWKGALKEEEIWGLVYYVRSLVEIKDSKAADQVRAQLMAPANLAWKPAAEAPAPTEAPPAAPAPAKK